LLRRSNWCVRQYAATARLALVTLSLLIAIGNRSALAQSVGDAIGTISFKQDSTGSVNGFIVRNLSDLLPTASPDNVSLAGLAITVGSQTVSFDTASGAPVIVAPGFFVDTTDPAFPTDNVLQYDAGSAPTSAVLQGRLLDSQGNSLPFGITAVMQTSDLGIPAGPGLENAPVTIFVTSLASVPETGTILTALLGLAPLCAIKVARRSR